MSEQMKVPDDLKAEYKRLRGVLHEVGTFASATMSVTEAITLIERIGKLEAESSQWEYLAGLSKEAHIKQIAENAALLKALTDEGAEVVNRVTAKVLAARKESK